MSLDLNYDYLDRVRRAAALYTKRKTSDLLEGDYSSMQHGRSLDFDDLREILMTSGSTATEMMSTT